jgi:PilZ domain-containing protein
LPLVMRRDRLAAMRERRSVPRYQYRARGRLVVSGGESLDVEFTTLSVRGCRLKGAKVPAAGTTCQVAFNWEGREFQGEGEVKWRKSNGDAGIIFTSIDEPNLMLIRRVCANLHLEPMAPPPPEPEGEEE